MPEYKTLHYFSIKGRGLYLAFGKLAGGGGGKLSFSLTSI